MCSSDLTVHTCEEVSIQQTSGKKDGVRGTHVRIALNAESVLFISDAERQAKGELWVNKVIATAGEQLAARVHAATSKESPQAAAIREFLQSSKGLTDRQARKLTLKGGPRPENQDDLMLALMRDRGAEPFPSQSTE